MSAQHEADPAEPPHWEPGLHPYDAAQRGVQHRMHVLHLALCSLDRRRRSRAIGRSRTFQPMVSSTTNPTRSTRPRARRARSGARDPTPRRARSTGPSPPARRQAVDHRGDTRGRTRAPPPRRRRCAPRRRSTSPGRNARPGTGTTVASPRTTSRPLARASSAAAGECSSAVTDQPRSARTWVLPPEPEPTSSARPGGRPATRSRTTSRRPAYHQCRSSSAADLRISCSSKPLRPPHGAASGEG